MTAKFIGEVYGWTYGISKLNIGMFDTWIPESKMCLRVTFTDGTFGLRIATFW